MNRLGIPLDLGFLFAYASGLALLAVFAYGLLAPTWRLSGRAMVVSGGLVVATLATTAPRYPDAPYLGLAMLSVWAAYHLRPVVFAIASLLAVSTRESGVVLTLVWLFLAWPSAKERGLKRLLPAVVPIAVFAIIRVILRVPDASIRYGDLVSSLVTPRMVIVGLAALLTMGLVSPMVVRFALPATRIHIVRQDLLVWASGALLALSAMALATNTTRMALISAPLFLAPGGWVRATSRGWIVAAGISTVGYAVADTLVNGDSAPFGQYPWFIFAGPDQPSQTGGRNRGDLPHQTIVQHGP